MYLSIQPPCFESYHFHNTHKHKIYAQYVPFYSESSSVQNDTKISKCFSMLKLLDVFELGAMD